VRGTTYVFGSSGFLFRSNKLMYDQQTKSLWHHLTGEPVVGPLADSGLKLRVLPIVTTRWTDWLAAHPDTVVLDINTGYSRDYTPGRPYGVYFASPGTMFPVAPRDERLRTKDWVFALRLGDQAKAYPLEALAREPVVNDSLGGVSLVIVAAAGTRTARAFERGPRQFRPGPQPAELVDSATGQIWSIEEDALVQRATGQRLPRLGGHLAYWFGWYAFYPQTLLYGK
jgi:hypothetical protein